MTRAAPQHRALSLSGALEPEGHREPRKNPRDTHQQLRFNSPRKGGGGDTEKRVKDHRSPRKLKNQKGKARWKGNRNGKGNGRKGMEPKKGNGRKTEEKHRKGEWKKCKRTEEMNSRLPTTKESGEGI